MTPPPPRSRLVATSTTHSCPSAFPTNAYDPQGEVVTAVTTPRSSWNPTGPCASVPALISSAAAALVSVPAASSSARSMISASSLSSMRKGCGSLTWCADGSGATRLRSRPIATRAGRAEASARASGVEKRTRAPRIARVNVCRRRARFGEGTNGLTMLCETL
eukprot:18522-Pelagococcus_subviridis.AAC.3